MISNLCELRKSKRSSKKHLKCKHNKVYELKGKSPFKKF